MYYGKTAFPREATTRRCNRPSAPKPSSSSSTRRRLPAEVARYPGIRDPGFGQRHCVVSTSIWIKGKYQEPHPTRPSSEVASSEHVATDNDSRYPQIMLQGTTDPTGTLRLYSVPQHLARHSPSSNWSYQVDRTDMAPLSHRQDHEGSTGGKAFTFFARTSSSSDFSSLISWSRRLFTLSATSSEIRPASRFCSADVIRSCFAK